jgi:hypothetical protein
MKTVYRGHEIEVRREECLGGWPMLYYSIYRQSDGYCCLEFPEDSDETVRDAIKHMKARVDAELEDTVDPWNEKGTYGNPWLVS